MPIKSEVTVLPADAQYQILSLVKVLKYFSITIFPSFKTIKAFEFSFSKKLYNESISGKHQPNDEGETVSQLALKLKGGK